MPTSRDNRRPPEPILLLLLLIVLCSTAFTWASTAPGTFTSSGPSSTHTVSFQYGADYQGVADSYANLTVGYEATNHGAEGELGLRNNGRHRPLFRFDTSTVPSGSTITQATLHLYVTHKAFDVPSDSLQFTGYWLNRPWVEDQVTAQQAAAGASWTSLGADAVPSDRSGATIAFGTLQPHHRGQFVAIDVTAAAQHWVSHPGENHGLLLIGSSASRGSYFFASSQSGFANQRPRLEIVYQGDPPLQTPTATHTPTPSPTPENWNMITSSTALNCIGAGIGMDKHNIADETRVLLVWHGTPWSAELIMDVNTVNCEHTIYINDHPIGKSRPEVGGYCKPGRTHRWTFDPSILVNGWNYVRVTADGHQPGVCWDNGWTALNIKIQAVGELVGPTVTDVHYGTRPPLDLKAWVQLPTFYSPDQPTGLLVALHAWSNDVEAASANAAAHYAKEADSHGWILAAPRIMGQRTASPVIQADLINLVNYMKARYAVDPNRIYITGTSMGGGIASVMAAKYPDLFAAAGEERGPTDLAEWHSERTAGGLYEISLQNEIGGTPAQKPFEYQRRSSRQMAQNLRHVPLIITHGAQDTVVPVNHGRQLYEAVRQHGGTLIEYHEYEGGHSDFPGSALLAPSPEGILAFLSRHSLGEEPPDNIHVRSDQNAKTYYWLGIHQVQEGWSTVMPHWTDVEAWYDPSQGRIWSRVYDQVHAPGVSGPPWFQVRLVYDLEQMGLDPTATYAIQIHQVESGETEQYTQVPSDGFLEVLMTGRNDPRRFEVEIAYDPLDIRTPTPSPTSTWTVTPTATPTHTATPTESLTPTETLTPAVSPTPTETATAEPSPTFARTATLTATPSATPSPMGSDHVIQGTAYEDLNVSYSLDPDEPRVSGMAVQLIRDNQVIAQIETDEDGQYRFGSLIADKYSLIGFLPPGYGASGPMDTTVTVPPDRKVNFRLHRLPTVTPTPTPTSIPSGGSGDKLPIYLPLLGG